MSNAPTHLYEQRQLLRALKLFVLFTTVPMSELTPINFDPNRFLT